MTNDVNSFTTKEILIRLESLMNSRFDALEVAMQRDRLEREKITDDHEGRLRFLERIRVPEAERQPRVIKIGLPATAATALSAVALALVDKF